MKSTVEILNRQSYSENLVLSLLLTIVDDTAKIATRLTHKEIGNKCGITPERVCQVIGNLERSSLIKCHNKSQPHSYEICAELIPQRMEVLDNLQKNITNSRKQSHNGDSEIIRANIQEIIIRAEAGESFQSIADDFQVNSCLISKECRIHGVYSKYKPPFNHSAQAKMDSNKDKIIEGHTRGASLKQLGEMHFVSPETIRHYLIEWGIDTSPAARKAKQLKI